MTKQVGFLTAVILSFLSGLWTLVAATWSMLGGRPRVGGIFILLAVLRILSYSQISSLAGIFTVLEILTSTLIVVFAIVLYMRPSKHVPCGLSIVILSLIAGGMSALVPMVIGLVGGLLAIRRKGIPPTAVN